MVSICVYMGACRSQISLHHAVWSSGLQCKKALENLMVFYNLCITLYVCFARIYAYMPHECLVSKEVRTRVE